MVSALATHPGDRWFESELPVFAKNADFFMIFEVYLRSMIDRGGGNVTKAFKLRLETGKYVHFSFCQLLFLLLLDKKVDLNFGNEMHRERRCFF